MKILDHRVLYKERHFHAAFPSIVRFADGNLLLAFRRARDGLWLVPEGQRKDLDPFGRMDHMDSRSHIMLMEMDSAAEHQLGELDLLPIDPEAGDQDPSLLVLPEDRILLASFSWYPLPSGVNYRLGARAAPGDEFPGCRFIFWGSHTSLRERARGRWLTDHGYLLPDGGYGNVLTPDGSKTLVGPVRGRPLWRNGDILLPVYGDSKEGCALFVSKNQGENWRYRGLIARDEEQQVTFQEPALCEDGRGGLVCFMRTAGAEGRLATCRSDDGVHWREPRLHDLVGHPFHPLPLADGRVLLSYGYRVEPFGVRARLLDNPLDDPDRAIENIIRDDGPCPDVGYPWGVQLEGGHVLLVYYWTDTEGIRQIVGSRLEFDW